MVEKARAQKAPVMMGGVTMRWCGEKTLQESSRRCWCEPVLAEFEQNFPMCGVRNTRDPTAELIFGGYAEWTRLKGRGCCMPLWRETGSPP